MLGAKQRKQNITMSVIRLYNFFNCHIFAINYLKKVPEKIDNR